MAKRICPYWIGFFLLSPLRKILQNPYKILAPYISSGMTVMDFGSAMGYFSLPIAKMVGPGGKVICVDIQAKMLKVLLKRATKAGLLASVETFQTDENVIDLQSFYNSIDFVLCFAVVHEIPDQEILFKELYNVVKTGGQILLSEPCGHVLPEAFQKTLDTAIKCGFTTIKSVVISRSKSVLLEKR